MIVQTIDIREDNFGLGDHREWGLHDRHAWHEWAKIPMEGCCDE